MAIGAAGMRVRAVGDGHSALDEIARQVPDIVLLDVMMPGRDGRKVLSAIRADEAVADLPVVICSGLSSDDDQWQSWLAGATSVVTKPFEVDELIEELRRHVRVPNRRAMDTAVDPRPVALTALTVGMVLTHDVVDPAGQLLLVAGQVVTQSIQDRLRRISEQRGVQEPIWVGPPSPAGSQEQHPTMAEAATR